MKNKITRTLTALCAALVLMGGFSVTAFAQGTDTPADATNDTGVVVEEPEETAPLTPEGNATLVDDFGGNKQLITVTTKAGNYFYILIDRDDEGENTVHFLNQVDDADLNALLEDGEAKEETPAVFQHSVKLLRGQLHRAYKLYDLQVFRFGFLCFQAFQLVLVLCDFFAGFLDFPVNAFNLVHSHIKFLLSNCVTSSSARTL